MTWYRYLLSVSLNIPAHGGIQVQKAFKEEQDAKFQNQGEASILRKKMEKVCTEINRNHIPPCYRETLLAYVSVV